MNMASSGVMRATVIDGFGPPSRLHSSTLPIPEPDVGEVLVRSRFAGVNPIDPLVASAWQAVAFESDNG
jgi:NADPH:quinone reductase-like Zn-dependent oxidoreductase